MKSYLIPCSPTWSIYPEFAPYSIEFVLNRVNLMIVFMKVETGLDI